MRLPRLNVGALPVGSHRIVIVAILGVAALLRFSSLDQVQVRGDQTAVLSLARTAWEQRRLPTHSVVSSVGVNEKPLELWLLMPAVALTPDPMVAPAVAALLWSGLDLLTVAILYRLGREGAGPLAGLVAAGAYGTSFWAVLFIRRIRGDDLMPLLTVASVLCWWRFVRGSRWTLPLAAAVTSLLLEVHLAAIFLLPLPLAGLLLGWRNLRLAPAIVGCAVAVLPWLPYVFWQGSEGFRDLEQALFVARAPPALDATSLRQLELLTSVSQGMPFLGTPSGPLFPEPDWAPWLQRAWHAWLAIGVLILIGSLVRRVASRSSAPSPPLSLWALAAVSAFGPALLLIRHSVPVNVHYFLGSLPAAYLFVGLACASPVRWLAEVRQRWSWFVAGALFVAGVVFPAAYQGVTVMRFYRWQQEAVTGFHGLPLSWWRDLVIRAVAATQGTEQPVLAYVDEVHAAPLGYLSAGRLSLRTLEPNTLVVPDRGPFVAMGSTERALGAGLLRDRADFQRLTWPGERDAGWVARLDAAATQRLRQEIGEAPFSWRAGDFLEFDVSVPDSVLVAGGLLPVTLRWHTLVAPGATADYGFFVHLLGGDGMSRSGLTASPAPAGEWRRGEFGLATVDLLVPPDLQPGAYHLVAGLYDPASNSRLPLLDVSGRPQPEYAVRLGPLKVPLPEAAGFAPGARPGAVFEGRIALINAAAQHSELRLLWRAEAPIGEELTRFVHLIDQGGRLRWQSDGNPRGGTYPTSIWAAGEVVEETLTLPPLADLDGSWHLLVGWYRQPSLARLLRSDAPAGESLDRVEISMADLPAP